jgi:hypothetical protein
MLSGTVITYILAIIAGMLAGVAVARGMREHSFGIFVDAIAGGVGALFGGLFLRDHVLLLVNASGDVVVTGKSAEQAALLILAGATEGGILVLFIAIVRMVISEHSQK